MGEMDMVKRRPSMLIWGILNITLQAFFLIAGIVLDLELTVATSFRENFITIIPAYICFAIPYISGILSIIFSFRFMKGNKKFCIPAIFMSIVAMLNQSFWLFLIFYAGTRY